jgi:hypothetical protein
VACSTREDPQPLDYWTNAAGTFDADGSPIAVNPPPGTQAWWLCASVGGNSASVAAGNYVMDFVGGVPLSDLRFELDAVETRAAATLTHREFSVTTPGAFKFVLPSG